MSDEKHTLVQILEHPLTWLFGSGGMGAILGKWSERRKTNAEAESTLSSATLGVMGELREQLKDALRRLERVESQNRKLLAVVFKLRTDNFTLRNYISIMTRRAGDPVVPPLLMDEKTELGDEFEGIEEAG